MSDTVEMCPDCGLLPLYLNRNYCRTCRNYRESLYRRPWSELSKEGKRRVIARARAHALRRKGILVQAPCELCHAPAGTEMHHPDYSFSALVMWLCHPCHMLHEGRIDMEMWYRLVGATTDNAPSLGREISPLTLPRTYAALARLEAAELSKRRVAA